MASGTLIGTLGIPREYREYNILWGVPGCLGVIFDVFVFPRFVCHILTSGGRLQARAGSVDTNLTRRIDPQPPENSGDPKMMKSKVHEIEIWEIGPSAAPHLPACLPVTWSCWQYKAETSRARLGPSLGPAWARLDVNMMLAQPSG